ncbi:conserved hypothetical protein [Culex quinquefasciatus]|uniref:RRM domain-containing protein n=1 Tax=Culex quinquefasciatus TaxID=7176 RepID=B0W686_CULQU|nr:conserved hypothetical protein [Culex quinquefasciatus]|eukprot:XP_001844220.1 conserved hypothetical protein [Culex quinquefasciatus]
MQRLAAEFAPFGTVSALRLVMGKETGRSKGFGYVQYVEAADAFKAMVQKNGRLVEGQNLKGYEISQDIVAPISIRASQHLDTVGDSSESQSVHQTRPQSQRSYAGRVLPPPEPGADPPFVPSRTTIASPLLPYISLPVICETFKFRLQIPIVESDVLVTEPEVTLGMDRAAAVQRCKNVRLD